MSSNYTFVVPGIPTPQGSMKAFVTGDGKAHLTAANLKLRSWRNDIAAAAQEAGVTPILGPVTLTVTFAFARPASHYGTGRNAGKLKPSAPAYYHMHRPDIDKLTRGCLDALTSLAYRDDAQVAFLCVRKRWDTTNRTTIVVWDETL